MLIADDFGLGRGHDRVILSLIESRRIDGTSVMAGNAIDPADLARLLQARDAGAQIGLHLNLTQALPGIEAVSALSALLNPAAPRDLRQAATASLEWQVDWFVSRFGSLPDFYDGHQHCHCFPSIVPLVCRLPVAPATWIRVPQPATWRGRWLNLRAGGAKVMLIMLLAARARAAFRSAGRKVNADFSGFLRLDEPASVRYWLPRLLAEATSDCLLMVHPGDAEDEMQCAGHSAESRDSEARILAERAAN